MVFVSLDAVSTLRFTTLRTFLASSCGSSSRREASLGCFTTFAGFRIFFKGFCVAPATGAGPGAGASEGVFGVFACEPVMPAFNRRMRRKAKRVLPSKSFKAFCRASSCKLGKSMSSSFTLARAVASVAAVFTALRADFKSRVPMARAKTKRCFGVPIEGIPSCPGFSACAPVVLTAPGAAFSGLAACLARTCGAFGRPDAGAAATA